MDVKNVAAGPWSAVVSSVEGIVPVYINVQSLIPGIQKRPIGLVAVVYRQLNSKNI